MGATEGYSSHPFVKFVQFVAYLFSFCILSPSRRIRKEVIVKRYLFVLIMLLAVVAYAQRGGGPPQQGGGGTPGQAPEGRGRGGRGPSPEQQAAAEAQNKLEASVPELPFDAVSLPLMPQGHTIGETEGVALNS